MRLAQWDVDTEKETGVVSDLPRLITNLFLTLVLIIKLKPLLHIDSSACAHVLSPIKREKGEIIGSLWGRFMDPVRLLNHVTDSTATRRAARVCVSPMLHLMQFFLKL